ncbi:MAG: hypothetical protein JWQ02_144 [Capsulimonas sp.]|nr:hypothetical protein [Capsulimonas sp.]
MALEWFSPQTPQRQQFDYKIVKSSIVITESGIFKISDGVTQVKLGYDSDKNVIGIAPAEAGDKTAFKLARRGRGIQHQVSAKKLFERFGLSPLTEAIEGNFEEVDGVLFASLAGGETTKPRRRRRTKAEMAAASAE